MLSQIIFFPSLAWYKKRFHHTHKPNVKKCKQAAPGLLGIIAPLTEKQDRNSKISSIKQGKQGLITQNKLWGPKNSVNYREINIKS